jgi:hypothetical protein
MSEEEEELATTNDVFTFKDVRLTVDPIVEYSNRSSKHPVIIIDNGKT